MIEDEEKELHCFHTPNEDEGLETLTLKLDAGLQMGLGGLLRKIAVKDFGDGG